MLALELAIHVVRTGLTGANCIPKSCDYYVTAQSCPTSSGANQIAEFKFSDITTRNDHVLSGRGLANIESMNSVYLKKSEGCDKPAW